MNLRHSLVILASITISVSIAEECNWDVQFQPEWEKCVAIWDVAGYTTNSQAVLDRISTILTAGGKSSGAYLATATLSTSATVQEQEAAAELLFPNDCDTIIIPNPQESSLSFYWNVLLDAGKAWVRSTQSPRRVIMLGGVANTLGSEGGMLMTEENPSTTEEFDLDFGDSQMISGMASFSASITEYDAFFCDPNKVPSSLSLSAGSWPSEIPSGRYEGSAPVEELTKNETGISVFYAGEYDGTTYVSLFGYSMKFHPGLFIWIANDGAPGIDDDFSDVLMVSVYSGRGEQNGGGNLCGMPVPRIFQLPAYDVNPPIMVTDQCGPGSIYLNDVSPSTCDTAGIVTPPGETNPDRQKTYWPLSLGAVPSAVSGLTLEQLNLRRVDMCSNEL